MTKMNWLKLTTAALALMTTSGISYAGYFVPGETMGVSLDLSAS